MLYGGLPDHYLGLINVSKTTAEALMQAICHFRIADVALEIFNSQVHPQT
jgi:hypothetical protein